MFDPEQMKDNDERKAPDGLWLMLTVAAVVILAPLLFSLWLLP